MRRVPDGAQTVPMTEEILDDTAAPGATRETSWHVITAGPSAGKTATLRDLSARGFRTAPEAARMVIDQTVSEGADPDEVREVIDFQAEVIAYDEYIESTMDPHTTTFFDRSLADNVAYANYYGWGISEDIIDACRNRYETVFVLEQLPFESDYARNEDADQSRELHETIIETYRALGYRPIEVPLMPVDERGDFICEQLGEHHHPSPMTYVEEI